MSKHPIQGIDDLFKVTGMEFRIMADQISDESVQLIEKAHEIANRSSDGD